MRRYFLVLVIGLISGCDSSNSEEGSAAALDTTMRAMAIVENCNDAAVQDKIRNAVSVQSVFGMSKEEAAEWLATETKPLQGYQYYDLDTLYDKHCVISLVVKCEWMGPYPTGYELHYNFDKRTGDSIGPAHIIAVDKMGELLKICDEQLQQAVKAGRAGLTEDDGLSDYDQIIGADPPTFTKESLNDFYIKDSTVTFVYHFAFPHVALAIEPPGEISFSFSEISPFLRNDGPLAFIKN